MTGSVVDDVIARPDYIDQLRLIRSENVGPSTFRRLMERFGSAAAALDALPDLARRGGRTPIRIPPTEEIVREIEALARLGGRFVLLSEADYPEALLAIEDPPPALAVLGNPGLLGRPSVGVVGSRNGSLNGRRIAEMVARALGEAGMVVVSGLARGIDTAAHRGALGTGTVAVVAGGVDVIYPEENRDLYGDIVARGAVVTELPVGVRPQARHFPRRNRLISGLSRGVVVVEASLRSGSLITARFALEQGREVFAVPGSPLDPRVRGCNDLIRQGAILTEGVADILPVIGRGLPPPAAELAPRVTASAIPAAEGYPEGNETVADGDGDRARHHLATLLSPTPVAMDDVLRNCHLSAATVHTILLEWELAGRLERLPGNRVALAPDASGA